MNRPSCSIIIPCYNEEGRLDLPAFREFIETHPDVNFIFVNDGSSDGTAGVLANFCSANRAEWCSLEKNSGKAEAVRQGMKIAMKHNSDYIGFWDADLATPLSELERMLESATEEMLYISGCRLLRLGGRIKRKWYRHYLGRVFATAVSLYLALPVYDTQCGAKLYKKECVPFITEHRFVTRWFFDVEILKRMTKHYGTDAVLSRSLELPLESWLDVSGSKLRYISCMVDFIKLFLYTK